MDLRAGQFPELEQPRDDAALLMAEFEVAEDGRPVRIALLNVADPTVDAARAGEKSSSSGSMECPSTSLYLAETSAPARARRPIQMSCSEWTRRRCTDCCRVASASRSATGPSIRW